MNNPSQINNQYHRVHIEDIINHNDYMKTFVVDFVPKDKTPNLFLSNQAQSESDTKSKPGQFIMLWIPGVDEKPFSLSGPNMITIKNVGPFTQMLFDKNHGYLNIRGPFGNGFTAGGTCTAIGGGCGIAPLVHLLENNNYCDNNSDAPPKQTLTNFVLAGKTYKDLIFIDKIKYEFNQDNITNKTNKKVVAVTEDGSYGIQGLVTDIMIPRADNYFICGPELMMKKIADKLISEGVNPSQIYLSLERYMKCAVGICGNCSMSGYRVCVDGPVFNYNTLKDLPHFNEFKRSRTGELVKK